MNGKRTRNLIFIITYIVVLVIFVMNFNSILEFFIGFIGLFSSFFIGLAIAFILNNPSKAIEKFLIDKIKIKKKAFARGLAITITYILLLLLIALLIWFVIPQLYKNLRIFLDDLGGYLNNLQALANNITSLLGVDPIDLSNISEFIENYIGNIINSLTEVVSRIISITAVVISYIAKFFVAIVFSIYLLANKEIMLNGSKKVLKVYIPDKIYQKLSYVYTIIVDVFNKYVVGQITEAIILGVLCFVGMVIFRFEYPLLISVIISILALIPVLGAYMGGLIGFLILLMISPMKAIWFIVFIVILQQFEGNVIYPRVVGSSIGLPSIWVLLSIVVGGGLAGPLGVLLGVPVATVFYILLKNDVNNRSENLENVNSKKEK